MGRATEERLTAVEVGRETEGRLMGRETDGREGRGRGKDREQKRRGGKETGVGERDEIGRGCIDGATDSSRDAERNRRDGRGRGND